MYFTILDTLDAVMAFMDKGGEVLWIIATLLLVMWSLIFERVWFLNTTHRKQIKNTLQLWNARSDKSAWRAKRIREMMISEVSLDLRTTLPLIETLMVVCPLLGLIGTVTGMIEVFYVMALTDEK